MPLLTREQLAAYDRNIELVSKLGRMCPIVSGASKFFAQLHQLFKHKDDKKEEVTVENVARILGDLWKAAEGHSIKQELF